MSFPKLEFARQGDPEVGEDAAGGGKQHVRGRPPPARGETRETCLRSWKSDERSCARRGQVDVNAANIGKITYPDIA